MLERIMEAGVRVFGQVGLSSATMSDVAREAGVSHGTIYNYVQGKEALFYLLIDWWLRDGPPPLEQVDLPLAAPSEERLVERLGERVEEVFALPLLDAALKSRVENARAAAVEFRSVVEELYERTATTRRAADMLERSAKDVPVLARYFSDEVRRPLFSRMERYLRARARAGFVTCPDPRAGARLLVEVVTFAARHRHRDPTASTMEEDAVRASTVHMLCGGLLAPSAAYESPSTRRPSNPDPRGVHDE